MRIQPIVYPTTLKGKERDKKHKDAETYEPINLAEVFGEVEDTEKTPSQKDDK